jgi:hypothetical protein
MIAFSEYFRILTWMTNEGKPARLLRVLLVLVAAASTPAWSQSGSDLDLRQQLLMEDPVNQELANQSFYDMWLFLSRSRTDWIRTSAAIYLLRGSDPELRDVGERLLTEMLASKPGEPHALWLLLKFCSAEPQFPGCASNDFQQRLIESDPENAAVYLVPVTLWELPKTPVLEDNEENRRTLLRASHAQRFDSYYGRDALQLYRELKVFAGEFPPAREPDVDLSAHARAFWYTWNVIMLEPQLAFSALLNLCEAQAVEGRMDSVDACLTLSRTMQETGKTLMTRGVGYSIERTVLRAMDGDEAIYVYLHRKSRMSTQVSMCQAPSWSKGGGFEPELEESAVLTYLADLETEGEVGALRNAGTREFLVYPDRFEQDPARCAELMTLDSEAMGAALGELDPGLQQR